MSPLLITLGVLLVCGLTLGQKYDYKDVLGKSILFFEAQRSGWLPEGNRIHWRGHSATGDGNDVGLDLTGGWYDAGDHVKFGLPLGFTATMLAWGVVDFRDGYSKTVELAPALLQLRWAMDYFVKCHPSKYEFYGQVGDGHADHAFWGRPEEMTMHRPSYKLTQWAPGSEVTAETAAALAAGFLVFKDEDPDYAYHLLHHARELYDFAYEYQGVYHDSITNAQDFYKSWSGYNDELVWGAAWLLRATGEDHYRQKAEQFYHGVDPWGFSWDEKWAGAQLMMFIATGDNRYRGDIENTVNQWLPGGGVQYTPKGLAFRNEWGSLRYAANMCAVALIAAKHGIRSWDYESWAESQINYMLGDTGRSFVIGYGNNPPTQPHHRSSSCDWQPSPCNWDNYNRNGPNPQILVGALVGGPDQWDGYVDRRDDYRANEVACDYNAGFQTALAGMVRIRQ